MIDELEARGLVHDISARDELDRMLREERVCFYAGYDPTASSLHVGHLVPLMAQWHLQQAGHKPIVVVGGATGMVGDPSGRSDERQLLGTDELAANVAAQRAQLARFLQFGDGPTDAVLVDNYEWLGSIGLLEFLREVGKHFTINHMIAKDSVRSRLEDREQGISYTEFSYMLLQAYDFVVLSRKYNCRLQVGGSDQWGNITAGIELSRRLGGPRLFGLTAPLLLDSEGKKMGKTSSGNRVWLDPQLTSPYAFYQYWLNQSDADSGRFLPLFSHAPLAELAEIVREHEAEPHRRIAQRALAEAVTVQVHGEEALRRALAASQVLFGGSLTDLTDADLEPLLADVPSSQLSRAELEQGVELVELMARTSLAQSKGAARRLISGGGVYVNNVRVADADRSLGSGDLGTESMMLLRAGKKNYHIVRVD